MLILKPNFDPAVPSNGGGAPPATPPTTPPTTPPAQPTVDEKETQEYETLIGKAETELNDQEKARLNELKGKYDVVIKGPDGKPLTPEQIQAYKANEKKFNDILAKAEDQRTDEEKKFLLENSEPEEVKSTYEQVDEQTGLKYEIDYKDVDPNSVEGVILREKTIRETAAREFENLIKAKYPQAYQYMLHLSQGGKPEDFLKNENQDFLQLTVKKDDHATNERVLRTALALKGNSPEIIDAIITTLKDSGKLFDTAKSELEALQANQKKIQERREQQEQARRQKEDKDINELGDKIDNSIEKGFAGIKVPIAERDSFAKFLHERIDYANGQFFVSKPLDTKELERELKFAYFEFKNGDLKDLVERKAATLNTLKFKNAIKPQIVPKNGSAGGQRKFKPIGEI